MAVEIKLLGNKIESGVGAEEYNSAVYLISIFENYFISQKDIDGTMLIKPNFKAVGEDPEDIDIVVWCNFENFKYDTFCYHSYFDEESNRYLNSKQKTKNEVVFKSMLINIELKSHNNSGVTITNNDVLVDYKGKKSSAYIQNNNQKYSLKNFINKSERELNQTNIFITNLIWFPNYVGSLGWGQSNLNNLILGNNIDFKKFIDIAFSKTPPKLSPKAKMCFQSAVDERNIDGDLNALLENIFDYYDKEILPKQGDLSRGKLEKVVQKQLNGKYKEAFESIGKNTLIIYGIAGSGKTLILLRFSYFLAVEQDARSLILTYNKALIADINRLSRLAGFKDDPSSASIGTSTCLKLMRKLFIEFGLYQEEPTNLNANERLNYFKTNFTNKYESLLKELVDLLKVADKDDIYKLKAHLLELNYQFVFVDESQDWYPEEKDILYALFGCENCIVSYGSHQLLRNKIPLDWKNGTKSTYRLTLKTSYRQKSNLCHYIKDISKRVDFNDEIEINNNLNGGQIKIYTRELNIKDYSNIYKYCVTQCKNAPYDILILVSSSDDFHKVLKHTEIAIHDGTIEKNKALIPTNMDASRVFNYQSCRGLEGWVVIANNLDVFLQEIENTIHEAEDGLSLSETKDKVCCQWLYMILSRPIDTLAISVKNSNSKFAQLLINVAEGHPDYCDIYN
jgi:hypothetical protein